MKLKVGLRNSQFIGLFSQLAFGLLLIWFVWLFLLDDRALWIDEFGTWLISQHADLSSWLGAFLLHPDSDGQLFFYHLYMFGWTKLFGDTELALRASNLPWVILCVIVVRQSTELKDLRYVWLFVFLLHGFVWFYLNEARPYSAFIAGGGLLTSAFVAASSTSLTSPNCSLSRVVCLFFLGSTLLICSHIFGALWVASTAGAIMWLLRDRARDFKDAIWSNRYLIAGSLLLCSIAISSALFSFVNGARAASINFSFSAVGYGVLEILGMAGLGPSRNDLRMGLSASLLYSSLPMIIAGVIGLSAVLSALRMASANVRYSAAFAALFPLLVIFLLGTVVGMRIVGRHFSALLMPTTLAYAFFIHSSFKQGGFVKLSAVGLACLLCLSSFLMRFSPAHAKEDYRQAAWIASAAMRDKKVVWWAADWRGAAYYGLIPDQQIKKRYRQIILKRTDSELVSDLTIVLHPAERLAKGEKLPFPSQIILSRVDFDRNGILLEFINNNGFRSRRHFAGFSVYEK